MLELLDDLAPVRINITESASVHTGLNYIEFKKLMEK
jgi:hypothetical protein